MKKTVYTSMVTAAIAFGFSACDKIEESSAEPVSNPQETLVDAATVTATPIAPAIDLAAMKDNPGEEIAIYTIGEIDGIPDGYSVFAKAEFAKTEDFANSFTIPAQIDAENVAYVMVGELGENWKETFGNDPSETTAYARLQLYLSDGKTSVRLGDSSTFYGDSDFAFTPFPADFSIEYGYSLVTEAGNIPFDHSSLSPYDDTSYFLTYEVPSVPCQVKIAPESLASTATLSSTDIYGAGTADDELMIGGDPIVINTSGAVKITISYNTTDNVWNYEVADAIPALFVVGNGNGWSFSQSIATDDFINYKGFATLDGAFKLAGQGDGWDPRNWGEQTASTYDDATATQTGALVFYGGDITEQGPKGLYYVEADIANLTYATVLISSVGITGDLNGWDAETAVPLKPSADNLSWSGEVTFGSEGSYKIIFNNDWSINLGAVSGDPANLWFGAGNLSDPGEGKYLITLDLSTTPATISAVKQ